MALAVLNHTRHNSHDFYVTKGLHVFDKSIGNLDCTISIWFMQALFGEFAFRVPPYSRYVFTMRLGKAKEAQNGVQFKTPWYLHMEARNGESDKVKLKGGQNLQANSLAGDARRCLLDLRSAKAKKITIRDLDKRLRRRTEFKCIECFVQVILTRYFSL
ncbi:uncharacterized protein CIMG_13296 [Coccidioides immitis RS]|uniref:Uncharacterized protein n=1 Tax=Coccidioides immitis (strain RS) TaxID=246410 RepID=J3K483_COCIM|nr:uncharacterized protein CIMG_13296 [Coccidioides immitis RS]EAS29090.3 hypothetical protein CIMG_13296 [Coccidioides immitis RS]